jgi:hypothetical protein
MEMRMAIAKIRAVGDVDGMIGFGSIGGIAMLNAAPRVYSI